MIRRDDYDEHGLRWAECERCGMGWIENEYATEILPDTWTSIGERKHDCPEPYPRETAEFLLAYYTSTGIPTSQRIKAQIKLGLES